MTILSHTRHRHCARGSSTRTCRRLGPPIRSIVLIYHLHRLYAVTHIRHSFEQIVNYTSIRYAIPMCYDTGEEGDEAPGEIRAAGVRSLSHRPQRGASQASYEDEVHASRRRRLVAPPGTHVRTAVVPSITHSERPPDGAANKGGGEGQPFVSD